MNEKISPEAKGVRVAKIRVANASNSLCFAQRELAKARHERRAAIIVDLSAPGATAEAVARKHDVTPAWVKTIRKHIKSQEEGQ